MLRTDLNLRWDEGEPVRVEEYRDRFPGLDAETLVVLEQVVERELAQHVDRRLRSLDVLRAVF